MNGQHLKALPEEESTAMAAAHLTREGGLLAAAAADSAFTKAAVKLVSKSMVRDPAGVACWCFDELLFYG